MSSSDRITSMAGRCWLPWRLALCLALVAVMMPTVGLAAGDVRNPTEVGGLLMMLDSRLALLRAAAIDVFGAFPVFLPEVFDHLGSIAATYPGGWTALVLGLVGALSAGMAAMLGTRLALRRVKHRIAADAWRSRAVLLMLTLDALERIAFLIVALAAMRILFSGSTFGDQLGVSILWAAMRTGLILLAADLAFRPGFAHLRLLPLSDRKALSLWWMSAISLMTGIGGISLVPVLLLSRLDIASAQLVALLSGNAAIVVAGIGLYRLSRLLRRDDEGVAVPGINRPILLAWCWLSLLGLQVFWTVGVLLIRVAPFHNLIGVVAMLGGVIAINAALGFALPPKSGMAARMWVPVFRRLLTVAALLGAALLIAETTAVGYLELMSQADWARLRGAMLRSAMVLLLGYTVWEIFAQWTARKIVEAAPLGPGHDDNVEAGPASRLVTVLPLVRTLIAIGLSIILSFVVLSELGVDTAPLIAGAGIFGLAISFGSQALVRDMVSGIFYLAEDAFRVGEYIESGELKGTVERIQTRSVRVRHQSGHLHTIPFGRLESVTNLSRDWTTMRFEIRLARHVDLERVRKVIKRIGQEMLKDEELGKDFILPMKLQGVREVAEHALVCRVKFTVKPVRPYWIQREALKRIVNTFRMEGIPFASNQVVVQGEETSLPTANEPRGLALPPTSTVADLGAGAAARIVKRDGAMTPAGAALPDLL